ncbi:hypothetical protein JYU34_013441 [Plutella xylostella]|uniref:Zinc finger CCCH domain-containing protein 14 n=1 Tax=Plutella xylostella TaxID=51655 RepID=A0ABQ7Q9T0_PLUXY|nr:hypothetical protein JYU34_013441 [Plutella xylostella]
MDVVGSEIGQKMRSAIKAKLTELGCYVDDELPDYVMVMVANKRTRLQMEDDLQLFLGDNTVQFVNWLHQVLQKLQEVTVTAPVVAKSIDTDKSKVRSESKDRKLKEKKDKLKQKHKKGDSLKKSKKKSKDKSHKKKDEKKSHKSKKKNKDKETEMIRPNVPPLLMNMEKDSEPSITDVFAGQILKNHGITIDTPKAEPKVDRKPIITDAKRPIIPIIDPATILTSENIDTEEDSSQNTSEISTSTQPEKSTTNVEDGPTNVEDSTNNEVTTTTDINVENTSAAVDVAAPREQHLKEIHEIETKIQGLRQKLADQLDSMSEDEDFLNIRTEAEELMTDFAEDVFQEISSANQARSLATDTPPLLPPSFRSPPPTPKSPAIPRPEKPKEPEVLPQIELNLPKRPIRERLGSRQEVAKAVEVKQPAVTKKSETRRVSESSKEKHDSPERFTPEREPDFWPKSKRRSIEVEKSKKPSFSEESSPEHRDIVPSKRLTSKVTVQPIEREITRAGPASVVRVRPRPRPAPAPASALLRRAMADAQKSLLNAPLKKDTEIKRGIVLPMRRTIDAKKIVIQIPSDRLPSPDGGHCDTSPPPRDAQYVPTCISKQFVNTEYVPSRRQSTRVDETLIVETINNHKLPAEKEKGPTFVVTLDGLDPNIFLAKKLKTEGLLDEEADVTNSMKEPKPKPKTPTKEPEKKMIEEQKTAEKVAPTLEKKRLSDTSHTSEESDTQVILQAKESEEESVEPKEKEVESETSVVVEKEDPSPVVRKRRGSPIVFDVSKKERVRERTVSTGSDSHVTVATNATTHKYDTLPPLSTVATPPERKPACRSFPACRFGPACVFAHPPCKFAAACTRRACVYSHPARVVPAVASHVVPAANFKTIQPTNPNMCKFYPGCVNPACHFYHPKPCRYGNACTNKLECNFYHHEQPASRWRVPYTVL